MTKGTGIFKLDPSGSIFHLTKLMPLSRATEIQNAMAILHRIAPQTPLDTLRALIKNYGEGDTAFQNQLIQITQSLHKQSLRVLGPALFSADSAKSLRRKILGLVSRFDWPEWAPFLHEAMLQEAELSVFDEGCAALSSLGTHEAYTYILNLQDKRKSPDHQTILIRERNNFEADQPFSHFLTRLQEGTRNPRLATQAARNLATKAQNLHIPQLAETYREGDELTQRLSLRVISGIQGPDATRFLIELIDQLNRELIDNLSLLETLRKTANLPRAVARDEFLSLVLQHFDKRIPEATERLSQAMHRPVEEINASVLITPLRNLAAGYNEAFLLDALELLIEGKVARFTAFHSESQEEADTRLARLQSSLDEVSEALSLRVTQEITPLDEAFNALQEPFRNRLGSHTFMQAFLKLVTCKHETLLDEILLDPDLKRRQACIDAIGTREEDQFTPFFLKAMQDPIVEVGQLAIHHLGKLPSAVPALMEQFRSGQLEQVRRAIRVFGENHTPDAAEPLLEFIKVEQRDTLLVEAVEALGNLRSVSAISTLLEMLHDGKPLNLQMALAKALGQMAHPEASLGLLQKATSLKHASVLFLCLEGSMSAFTSFEAPMPPDELDLLWNLVERCCDEREGEGQRLPTMLAMIELYTFDRDIYDKLRDRFSDYLSTMRTQANWDRSNNEKVSAVIKELSRRSSSLHLLSQKENAIQLAVQAVPPKGPKRSESLMQLRDLLKDPELILRPEMGLAVGAFVFREIHREGNEWRELAMVCEIGGLSRQLDLSEPIHAIYIRATSLGLKSAAKEALLNLGLKEGEINRRLPIRSILVLEPSAFFRTRLLSVLKSTQRYRIWEAGSREAAEKIILQEEEVDLLLTETHDEKGDLGDWIEQQWKSGKCRRVMLSASNRDLGEKRTSAWFEEALFKPYKNEQLLSVLEAS